MYRYTSSYKEQLFVMKSKLITYITGFAATIAIAIGLVAPQPAYAADLQCSILPQNFCKSANNEVKGQPNSKNSAVFMILQWVLAILTGGVAIAAVAAFVWAGIMYSSAGGSADMVKKAKDIMTQTVIGLVAFAAIALVLTWLIPGGVF